MKDLFFSMSLERRGQRPENRVGDKAMLFCRVYSGPSRRDGHDYAADRERIVPRETDAAFPPGLGGPDCPAWTITRGSQPIAIAGLAPMADGTDQLWSVVAADLSPREWWFARHCLRQVLAARPIGRKMVALVQTAAELGFLDGLGFELACEVVDDKDRPFALLEAA